MEAEQHKPAEGNEPKKRPKNQISLFTPSRIPKNTALEAITHTKRTCGSPSVRVRAASASVSSCEV